MAEVDQPHMKLTGAPSSPPQTRREFLKIAALMGATAGWAWGKPITATTRPKERRDLFPEGVASADPDAHSVILWTRRPFAGTAPQTLRFEVAQDSAFTHLIAAGQTTVSAALDWTSRVLVGNLQPATHYWYRFVDTDGNASRVGRAKTAPSEDDPRPTRFAFVSCQSINMGYSNAYKRMIHEDVTGTRPLDFVLHLGDFVYECVLYPEDNPTGWAGRKLRDVVRYPKGDRHQESSAVWHSPTDLNDYRHLYRAHLADQDLQDARAHFPFVSIWDNCEFSDGNWQSMRIFHGVSVPSQTQKIAANQAWYEYQPARLRNFSADELNAFQTPAVADTAPAQLDAEGFAHEKNNVAAVGSLSIYRNFRYGRNVEVILTDLFSYKAEPMLKDAALEAMADKQFAGLFPEGPLAVLDGGQAFNQGNPPDHIVAGGKTIPNTRKNKPAQALLGAEQRAWFAQRLTQSQATWKIWGHSQGNLHARLDVSEAPPPLKNPWPEAQFITDGSCLAERAAIHDLVRDRNITGFVTVSGNYHSFWAGLGSAQLPPTGRYQPVGLNFITGAISSPSYGESLIHMKADKRPFGQLSATDRPGRLPDPTINILYRHGFKSAAEFAKTGDIGRARALSNPQLAPQLKFLDLVGQGYSTVSTSADAFECEFVCIKAPSEPATAVDGGPLVYRVVHRAKAWKAGQEPHLELQVLEGNPSLSI